RDPIKHRERALLQLAKLHFPRRSDLRRSLQKITEAAVRCLEVSRASIWLLSPGGESLRCHAAYDQLSKANVERLELPAAHFSLYWKFLKQRLTIAAENVETDPAFQEILKDYMRPNGIRATLDAGIHINGAL